MLQQFHFIRQAAQDTLRLPLFENYPRTRQLLSQLFSLREQVMPIPVVEEGAAYNRMLAQMPSRLSR